MPLLPSETVDWKCDEGHVFSRRVSRYLYENYECPVCDGRRPGTLAEIRPDIAAEWSPSNSKTPDQVSLFTWEEVLWVCSKCQYEWAACVANRTSKGSGCPVCWKRRGATSLIEQASLASIQSQLNETLQNSQTIIHDGRRVHPDMLTHDKIVVEYDSKYWHNYERDIERIALMESAGYTVISIRERGLDKIKDRDISYDPRNDDINSVSSVVVDQIRAIREGTLQ